MVTFKIVVLLIKNSINQKYLFNNVRNLKWSIPINNKNNDKSNNNNTIL